MNRFFLVVVMSVCIWEQSKGAVDTIGIQIPIGRQLIHENIDREQVIALNIYKNGLDSATSIGDTTVEEVENALTSQVDKIQLDIETGNYDHRIKYYYLNGIYQVLRLYSFFVQYGKIDPSYAPQIIQNFRKMLETDAKGKSIASCVEDVPYEVGEITTEAFQDNFGYRVAKSIVFRKFAKAQPEEVLTALDQRGPYAILHYGQFLNEPFTDSIIATIAHKYPQRVYDYATSFTSVGNEIRNNPDTLVQAIYKIGQSPNAIKILPFLEYIVDGTYTVKQLEAICQDDDAYYKLCVKTEIDMRRQQLEGKTVLNMVGMQDNLKIRALKYIREVNDLHESPDPVRFACVDKFTPQEIYYLLINGQEEIYTSSYVGLFKRMMERMDPPEGDELLMSVYFDHFKLFITMSAAYNTLNDFLHSMAEANSTALMEEFVAGLQKTPTLEDAEDVADAFGSIKDSSLLLFLRREVDKNYLQMQRENDKRGKVIYALLASLFTGRESSDKDSVWTKDISARLNLPPIDKVPFKSLIDDSGRVNEEVFFYGDKDGFDSYSNFMTSFRAPDWRVSRGQYWVTINSVRGKPITLYVKLPFSDPDEDDYAMSQLSQYLRAHNIHPTVYIHRGHSYHVNATIAELQNSARIVMLGSCGGYNSLAGVLDVAPLAQIISSKQTGTMFVNEPIIRAIEETIRAGKDVDWIPLWNKLSKEFKGTPHQEQFEDYIPPHKNMGAIFIQAYRHLMKNNGDQPAS
jgi:hypothetical protein